MYKALLCGCVVEIELKGYGQIWDSVDIEYCTKHAAASELYEALYHSYLWMKVHQRDGPLSTNSDGFNHLLDKADAIISRVMKANDTVK